MLDGALNWLGELRTPGDVQGRGVARVAASVLASHAGALAQAGVTHALFELHGPSEAAHAQVRSSVFGEHAPEPFDAVLAGIGHARAHGIRVVVVSVASRSSMRVLRDQGDLLARLGTGLWWIKAAWAPPELPLPQLPRAALSVPFVLDAAVRARRAGLETVLDGFPWCLLGPHTGLSLASESAATGAPCAGCAAALRCSGLGPAYRQTFGTAELRPIEAQEIGQETHLIRTIRQSLRGGAS